MNEPELRGRNTPLGRIANLSAIETLFSKIQSEIPIQSDHTSICEVLTIDKAITAFSKTVDFSKLPSAMGVFNILGRPEMPLIEPL